MTAQTEWSVFLSFSPHFRDVLQFLLVLFSLIFQFHFFVIKRRTGGVCVEEIQAHVFLLPG
jgi:hypothetical protein